MQNGQKTESPAVSNKSSLQANTCAQPVMSGSAEEIGSPTPRRNDDGALAVKFEAGTREKLDRVRSPHNFPRMCNLYSMTRAPEAVLRLFRVSHNRAASIEGKPAIFPGYVAPVVRKAPDGERELVSITGDSGCCRRAAHRGVPPRRCCGLPYVNEAQ
jgi:hypothetical protein